LEKSFSSAMWGQWLKRDWRLLFARLAGGAGSRAGRKKAAVNCQKATLCRKTALCRMATIRRIAISGYGNHYAEWQFSAGLLCRAVMPGCCVGL
jgi:hypothetical protein